MISEKLTRTVLVAFSLGWTIVANTCLYAQSTFGSIIGTVQDASGAAIPGVSVQVKSLGDSTSHAAITDAAGGYQILNLKPGSYEVIASKENFANATISGVALDTRQQLCADLKLELAGVTQTVSVEAEAGAVNTENAIIGDTKNFKQVVQLPMNYRGGSDSPLAALVAVPGVQQDSNGNLSIGGGTSAQIQYSVDGTSTVNVRQNGALTNMNPSSELISKMKVTQFNNNAERAAAATIGRPTICVCYRPAICRNAGCSSG